MLSLLPVLNCVHQSNVIHRDIKPDNVIIRQRDNKPVLIDFGIVKEVMRTDTLGNPDSSIMAGTSGYMSLEQAAGKPVFASDVYSVGMTYIYLLTGKHPNSMIEPLTGEMRWREHAPNVSAGLAVILDKATEPLVRDRYKTASEMEAALSAKVQEQRSKPDELSRFHADAKRFARLLVQEIIAYNEEKIPQALKNKNLYDALKAYIDKSREMYDKRAGSEVKASGIDYFHEELVRTLCDGDSSRLGANYPRPKNLKN